MDFCQTENDLLVKRLTNPFFSAREPVKFNMRALIIFIITFLLLQLCLSQIMSPGKSFDSVQFSGTSDLYFRATPSSNPVYGETPAGNGKEYVPFYYWVLFLFFKILRHGQEMEV
jgi:hypothetical protein